VSKEPKVARNTWRFAPSAARASITADREQLLRNAGRQAREVRRDRAGGFREDGVERGAACERAAHDLLGRGGQIAALVDAEQTHERTRYVKAAIPVWALPRISA
jgi:hypothetical protein